MKMFVAKNFVLLKPLGEIKNKSGIVLPEEQGKEKQVIGVVEMVGLGKQPFPVVMKKGDTVVYKKYMENTTVIPHLGEKFNPVAFEDLTVLIKNE